MNNLEPLFNPESIAIIGATNNKNKLGYSILKGLIEHKFTGIIYPINKKNEKILGLTNFKKIEDVKENIDLVIICVPSIYVKKVVDECINKKVKFCIIVTSGFGESLYYNGIKLERQLITSINNSNTRIIGPNSNGIINSEKNLFLSTTRFQQWKKGSISIVAHGGAFTGCIASTLMYSNSFGINKCISLGNRCDLKETEVIKYLQTDPSTKVIGLYTEKLDLKLKNYEKPLVVMESGITNSGLLSANLHTGRVRLKRNLKNDSQKASFIKISNLYTFFDLLKTLTIYKINKKIKKIGLLSMSGTYATLTSDLLETNGFVLSKIRFSTDIDNKKIILTNPYDLWFSYSKNNNKEYINVLERFKNHVDALLIIIFDIVKSTFNILKFINILKNYWDPAKPVFVAIIGGTKGKKWINLFDDNEIPSFIGLDSHTRIINILNIWNNAINYLS